MELGLTFCPVVNFDYVSTRIYFFRLIQKLKLKKHFQLKERRGADAVIGDQEDMPVPSTLCIGDLGTLLNLCTFEDEESHDCDPIEMCRTLGLDTGNTVSTNLNPNQYFVH